MPRLRFSCPSLSVRIARNLLLMAALGLASAPAIAAQSTPPAIAGIVVDPQGTPLVLARVRLISSDGAEVATAVTDRQGRFTLVPNGAECVACRVEAALPGFVAGSVPAASAALEVRLAMAPVREAIVVTPTRGETPASLVGSSVTVLTADDIDRRGAPVVSELLKATPSVTVVRTGGVGNVTSLFVRGGESDYNKVLLDGIPLNEPGGSFNFGNLTTDNVERIEVVRGAMSALFGSDAMSSVIQLFTRRARSGSAPRASATIEGGSYATARMQAGVSANLGRWDLSASAGRLGTDNRVPNNRFDNTTVSVTAGGPLGRGDAVTLRSVLRLERQRVGVPGQTAFGRPDSDALFDRNDTVVGLSVDHHASARWRQRAGFSVSRSTQISTNRFEDAPYTPTFEDRSAPFMFFDFLLDTTNTISRYSTNYQGDLTIGGGHGSSRPQVLTVAVDVEAQRAELADTLAGTSLPAARDNVGVALQHQMHAARLSTTAGVRVEHNASFGTAVVPRASLVYLVHSGTGHAGDTSLRASAGLGVKEPTILETFSQNRFFLGNPDLAPERSTTFDVGIEQRLFRQHAKVELTWFDGRYRNQISTRTIDPVTFSGQYFNIGRTRARGTELTVEVSPVSGVRVRAGHTFLDSVIVESTSPSSAVFREGAWTFRRPRHSGFLDLSVSRGRAALDLSGVFSGRRVDSDFASLNPPILESNPPALWTLGVRLRVTRQTEGYLRIENLSNATYMDPLGYEAWQRSLHAGLRLTF